MSEDLEGDWEVTIGREVGRRVETSRKAEFEVKLDGKSYNLLTLVAIAGFFFTDFSATPTNGFAGFLSLGRKPLSLDEKN